MRKDTRTMMGFMTVFTIAVIFLSNDIQIKLDNKQTVKENKIKGNVQLVSVNKITEYVANAQIVKGTSAIIANAAVTEDDLNKSKEQSNDQIEQVTNQQPTNNGVATAGWAWPTQAGWSISSDYGYRSDPFSGAYSFHGALDIYGPGMGSAIYSVNNGVIHEKGWTRSYGYYYVINHNNGYYTLYAHMSGYVGGIEVGSVVAKGQHIGFMGMTGSATGPHLHLETWIGVPWGGGYMINPWSLY